MAEQPHEPARGRRFWVILTLITVAGLVLRVAYVWFWRRRLEYGGDAYYYHEGANLLAEGRGFLHPFGARLGIDTPGADHPPLYTLYLSTFSVVGLKSVTQHLLASALLGAAAIPLIGVVGRRLRDWRVGLVAAFLLAFYPNTWRYDGSLMSETIVIVTVLLVLWAALRYLDAPGIGRFALVGLALGVAAAARSELLLLIPIMLPLLAFGRPMGAGAQRWRCFAVGAAVTLAVVLPWPIYNLSRFDSPVLFTTNAGGTFAVSNCDGTYSGPNMGYWDPRCGTDVLTREGIDPLRQGAEADKAMREAGVTYITEHKSRVPLVVAARLGRITDVFRPFNQADLDVAIEQTEPAVANAGVFSFWFIGAFAIGGIVLLRRRRVELAVLLTPVVVVLVASAAFYATTRFRASAEPSLCLLAAVAMVALGQRAYRKLRPRPETETETA